MGISASGIIFVFLINLYPKYRMMKIGMLMYEETNVPLSQLHARISVSVPKGVLGRETYCPLMKTAYPPVRRRTMNEIKDSQAAYGWNGAFHGSSERSIPWTLQP
jgi:hypothetical protein